MKVFVTIVIFLTSFVLFSQTHEEFIKEGNQSYQSQNYKEAEINYRKALDLNPRSDTAKFNLGNALYKQGKYQEALDKYLELDNYNMAKDKIADIYHNLGNSYMESEKYNESIEAYKKALKNDPSDTDTKYNLAYALEKMRKEQQQQQQNQDQNNENQDKNEDKQEQNQDKNNQDKQDQQDQDQQQQNEDQNQNKEDQQQQQQNQEQNEKNKEEQNDRTENRQQQENKISKKDAERILQALMNEEKDLLKEMRKLEAKTSKTEKNW